MYPRCAIAVDIAVQVLPGVLNGLGFKTSQFSLWFVSGQQKLLSQSALMFLLRTAIETCLEI